LSEDVGELDDLASVLESDFEHWASGLSPLERQALQEYQEGWAGYVNSYLRGELDASSLDWDEARQLAQVIEGVESALDAGTLERNITVFRGISDVARVFGGDPARLIGEVWVDHGFLSTAIDREFVMQEFVRLPAPGLMELRLATGQHAAWLPSGGGTQYYHEGEVLLPYDSPIMIQCVMEDPTGLATIRGEVILD
jgi:ADP-ribosyltransferase exoenzyme